MCWQTVAYLTFPSSTVEQYICLTPFVMLYSAHQQSWECFQQTVIGWVVNA